MDAAAKIKKFAEIKNESKAEQQKIRDKKIKILDKEFTENSAKEAGIHSVHTGQARLDELNAKLKELAANSLFKETKARVPKVPAPSPATTGVTPLFPSPGVSK